MSDIPKDIMDIARDVADGWELSDFCKRVHTLEIAATIFNERERCANVAREWMYEYGQAYNSSSIMAAILE